MPILSNPKLEAFAQLVASGTPDEVAFERAGYIAKNKESLRVGLKRVKTQTVDRVQELLPLFNARLLKDAAAVTETTLTIRSNRIKKLEDLHKRIEIVVTDRACHPDMRNVIGGRSGLISVQHKNLSRDKDAKIILEASFDSSVVKAMLDVEKQIAMEAGQWAENVDNKTRALRSLSELPDSELDMMLAEGEQIMKAREESAAMNQELPTDLEQ